MASNDDLKDSDYRLLLGCLRDIYALSDAPNFPQQLLRVIARLVNAKLITFTEVDPVLGKTTGYYFPSTPSEDFTEPFQRHVHEHPVVQHMERTRDGSARAVSDFLTTKVFRKTGMYREVFKPMGVIDQLSIAMVGSGGLMIGISFNRARRGFSSRDRAILNLLRPHIIQAYMNCRVRYAIDSQANERYAYIFDQLPLGLICVSADGRVVWITRIAQQMLQHYYPDAEESIHGLPDPVRYWLKRAAAKSADGSTLELRASQGRLELYLRYCPLNDGRTILIARQETVHHQRSVLGDYGLTPREQQVAERIIRGENFDEAATHLAISPRTAQKHMERIFRKLGVNNLAAACMKLVRS